MKLFKSNECNFVIANNFVMALISAALSLVFISISNAATLNVPSVQYPTVQSAVNAASFGDIIVLQAGMTYTEQVILRYKPGSGYITIQSSALSSLPVDGRRVSPSDSIHMPRIVPPPPLPGDPDVSFASFITELTANGPTHGYRLVGLEIAKTDSDYRTHRLIQLGASDSSQNSLSKVPYDFEIDRCYIHGTTNGTLRRGVTLNSANTTISDSYISDVHEVGADSQAICGWNGPGPYSIVNNYLEAAGENIMFGGADPDVPNLVPSDITVRRNLLSKNLSWYTRVPAWSVKNIFELKNAKRVNVQENILENNWAGSQNGYAILFTVRNQGGSAPWSTVEDVDFSDNIVRNTPRAINILGQDDTFVSQNAKNFVISNNLIVSSSSLETADGKCLQITNIPSGSPGIENLNLIHNTCVGLGPYPYFIAGDNSTRATGLYIRDNIAMAVTAGTDTSISGNEQFGSAALNSMSGTLWSLQKNILMLPSGSSGYPNSGSNLNSYVSNSSSVGFVDFQGGNYALSSNSPYRNTGTDGTDPGANIAELNQIKPCIESGNWSSCTGTQSPFPGPTPPAIPLTLEVENYDNGGEGIAYHELFGNSGAGTYRSGDAVDLQSRPNEASNGLAVFESSAGEWLEYTVNVPLTRHYDIGVRYSSEFNNGTFHIEDCGSQPNNQTCAALNLTGTLTASSTGGWGVFRVVTKRRVLLTQGVHVLRLKMDSNSPDGCACIVGNFDAILFNTSSFDFDNDGRADISVFRPSQNAWYLNRSKDGPTAISFGLSTDIVSPADFDGDGKTDVAIFRPSTATWWILKSTNGQVVAVTFGLNGDFPVAADYDGDGTADIAVWRPSDGTWYRINSSNGAFVSYPFGLANDKPAIGDYDGDGKFDYAVFRPSTGLWYLQQTTSGTSVIQWGLTDDKITPGDYDGDGKTDVAVWRPSTATWYRMNSSTGSSFQLQFGLTGDIPVPADYDADGKIDLGLFRPSSGIWYLLLSTNGSVSTQYGVNGDIPLPSTIVR